MRRALLPALLACMLASAASAAEPLRPRWTGPVYGVFTDAGPDSAQGPRAKIHVPIGVALTKPVTIKGFKVTPEASFEWTTKAYLGEESQPLRDPSYHFTPYFRIEPDSVDGLFQWAKVTFPDHISNGDDDLDSRSLNAVSGEVSLAWEMYGVAFDLYAKGWVIYDYGTNTEDIGDALNLVEDFGGRVILRGAVDALELATELGPEWQKYMAYVPLQDFYNFGLYAELHNGKMEGLLEYGEHVTKIGAGLAFKPE